MQALRQVEKDLRDQTVESLNETFAALQNLLLITAGPESSEIEVEMPEIPGRAGKNKKLLQEMYQLAAKCRIASRRVLDAHT